MNRRLLVVLVLVLLDLPLDLLLFRLIFRGYYLASTSGAGREAPAERRTPRLADFLDPDFLKGSGGQTKLMLLLFSAAILVLIEYSILVSLLPGLSG